MSIMIRQSEALLEHLKSYEVDGATVDSLLFAGGRLHYPGRKEVEQLLGFADPYTIELEARTIDGLFQSIAASIRLLASEATRFFRGTDPTLDLLWGSHAAYQRSPSEGPSLDRLIAALVMVEHVREHGHPDRDIEHACTVMINGMIAIGFPASEMALEELCDGSLPACAGLNLIEIPSPRGESR